MDFFKGVNDFNKTVIGAVPPVKATSVPKDRLKWLEIALCEELNEFLSAESPEDQADALIDLMYFAAGELYKMGVDGQAAFNEVHRANMQKVRGELAKRPGSKGYDAVKPPGWEAPDLSCAMKPARPRIMIAGYSRRALHTVATMLSVLGFKYNKQGDEVFIEDFFYPYAMRRNLIPETVPMLEVLHNQDKYSYLLRNAYAHFWQENKMFLVDKIQKNQDIYCNVTNAAEVVEAFRLSRYDHLVWVDNSRVEYSAAVPSPDFTVTPSMANYVIKYDGNTANLANNVYEFSKQYGLACELEQI